MLFTIEFESFFAQDYTSRSQVVMELRSFVSDGRLEPKLQRESGDQGCYHSLPMGSVHVSRASAAPPLGSVTSPAPPHVLEDMTLSPPSHLQGQSSALPLLMLSRANTSEYALSVSSSPSPESDVPLSSAGGEGGGTGVGGIESNRSATALVDQDGVRSGGRASSWSNFKKMCLSG